MRPIADAILGWASAAEGVQITRKVRLTSVDQVDDELLDILVTALEQNS